MRDDVKHVRISRDVPVDCERFPGTADTAPDDDTRRVRVAACDAV